MPEPPPVIQATLPFKELASGILRGAKQDLACSLLNDGVAGARSASTSSAFFTAGRCGDPVAPAS